MGIRTEYKCDIIGCVSTTYEPIIEGWFIGDVLNNSVRVMPFAFALASEFRFDCLCGETCAIKYAAQKIAKLNPARFAVSA